MPKDTKLREIADLLEKCASDEANASRVFQDLDMLTFSGSEAFINDAIHFLNHFSADTDIRAKDKEYDRWQRNRLMEYVNKIRALPSL
jgi:hypothetical protein